MIFLFIIIFDLMILIKKNFEEQQNGYEGKKRVEGDCSCFDIYMKTEVLS